MKNNPTLIAIVCGLLSACLFLSQVSLGGLGLILSTFTAFPLFISVLGFGTRAGIISGIIAAAAVGVMFGLPGTLIVLLFTLLPALWIGHMVGLSRDDTGTAEWFPVSTILFRMAGMSACIAIVAGLATGYSEQSAQQLISEIITQLVDANRQANGGAELLSAEEITQRTQLIAKMIPFAFPVSIFLLLSINLLPAANFARKRGWMLRPKDNLPLNLAMPPLSLAILVAAVAATLLLPSPIGLIAMSVAGAFGAAFIAIGLATIHCISSNMPGRGLLLTLVYVALLFMPIVLPLIMLLGVVETLFSLRARFAASSSST